MGRINTRGTGCDAIFKALLAVDGLSTCVFGCCDGTEALSYLQVPVLDCILPCDPVVVFV